MYFLRYVGHLLYRGLWYSIIVTGLIFSYASRAWGMGWELARQTNLWLFVFSALAGAWIGFAQSSEDPSVHTVGGSMGKNFLGKGLWAKEDANPQSAEPLLPFGWRLFVMSFTPLGISLLIWLGEIWL